MKINIPGWGIASVPDDFESWETEKQEALIADIKKTSSSSGYKTSLGEKTEKKIKEGVFGIIGLYVIGAIIAIFGFLNVVLNQ
ncbi:hypothetical protein N9D36_07090 [Gammaproteobacteria bacterium]|nr:hypothetical protein [Gammaproteobacteria bacterium]